MKKIIPILVLLSTMLACGLPAATPTSSDIQSQDSPYVGLWMNDTESYVFTQNSLYHVVSRPESGQVNEEFSEITSYDPASNHLTLRKVWVRVNGKSVGFDSPAYSLTISINGDSLQLGLGTETEFAIDLDPAVFTRK